MRQLKAASALVLTAFFAVAGAYHHHRLPGGAHSHVGLCSDTSAGPSLDSCAICQATHAAADRLASITVTVDSYRTSSLTVNTALAPTPVNASLLYSSRAPPAV